MTNSEGWRESAVMMSSAVPASEELALGVAAHIRKAQHRHRRLVGQRQWLGEGRQRLLDGDGAVPNSIHTHWPALRPVAGKLSVCTLALMRLRLRRTRHVEVAPVAGS